MYRPTNIKVFEPLSPEYALASVMTEELIRYLSPKILWWMFDRETTEDTMDQADQVYAEKSSGEKIFLPQVEIEAHFEINPIIQELTRLGVEQIEEVNLFTNIDHFREKTDGKDPKAGDVLRLSYIVRPEEYRQVFYNVSTVVPVDLFNFRYLNWKIYATQTNMADIPQNIKDYIAKDAL